MKYYVHFDEIGDLCKDNHFYPEDTTNPTDILLFDSKEDAIKAGAQFCLDTNDVMKEIGYKQDINAIKSAIRTGSEEDWYKLNVETNPLYQDYGAYYNVYPVENLDIDMVDDGLVFDGSLILSSSENDYADKAEKILKYFEVI